MHDYKISKIQLMEFVVFINKNDAFNNNHFLPAHIPLLLSRSQPIITSDYIHLYVIK